MTDAEGTTGPLDVPTLDVLGRRAITHPLVDRWTMQPDAMSPRRLELHLDATQYPPSVETAKLDVRWFEGGDYTVHYRESADGSDEWQCRWDRHPKPEGQRSHYHLPPDAAPDVVESNLAAGHHLDVLFDVLDRIERRIETLHGR